MVSAFAFDIPEKGLGRSGEVYCGQKSQDPNRNKEIDDRAAFM